jgi:hypothetical protein
MKVSPELRSTFVELVLQLRHPFDLGSHNVPLYDCLAELLFEPLVLPSDLLEFATPGR